MKITVSAFTLSLPRPTHCQLSSCSSSRTPSSPQRSSSSPSWNVVYQYLSKLEWRPSSNPYMMRIWSLNNDCKKKIFYQKLLFSKKKNGPSLADRWRIRFKFRANFLSGKREMRWEGFALLTILIRSHWWPSFPLEFFLTSISISNKEDVSFVLQLYDPRNQQKLTRQQVQFDNSCPRLQEDAEPN